MSQPIIVSTIIPDIQARYKAFYEHIISECEGLTKEQLKDLRHQTDEAKAQAYGSESHSLLVASEIARAICECANDKMVKTN